MKIVYASCACSKRRFLELFPVAENMPGQQVQKYHRLMLEGLARNGVPVTALTSAPITRLNYGGIVARIHPDDERGVHYRYLPIINIPVVKNILILLSSFARTCGYLRKDKEAAVICDVLNFSVSTGALLAAKLLGRSNTGIVTDIPRFLSDNPNPLFSLLTSFVMMRYDSYVFLTHQMSSLINRRGVPQVVIEGQVDIEMEGRPNDIQAKHGQFVCLYAGAIDRRYGVETLVRGFLDSHNETSELRIYGAGDYAETLAALARENTRVRYFGIVPNEVVVEEQLRATLLVNPRPSTEAFTIYSHPSKNMEYMVSGTPLLTTVLPGMPDEYLGYVYLLRDETAEGVASALEGLFGTDRHELHRKGQEAKDFVLEKKNNILQAHRVVELIRTWRRERD